MKRFRNKLKSALAFVLTTTLLMGCGIDFFAVSPQQEQESEQGDLIVVGISQLGSESVWRTANTQSVQEAISKENGFFPIFTNARQKQDNQIKEIRGFISQRVDYIVFAPVIETGWDTILKEAKDAGIPVILMDRVVDVENEDLYTTSIATDKYEEGVKAGEWLKEYLSENNRADEEINIVVLQGTLGSSPQIGRSDGFNSVAKLMGNWNILEEIDADFTTTRGKEVMQQLLSKYDDIDVVVSQNDDMTFGAVEAMNEKGITTGVNGDVILISFDAVHDALQMVQDGIINADVECNPNQGEYIANVIKMMESGEEVEKQYIVGEKLFTIDNVNEYIDKRNY